MTLPYTYPVDPPRDIFCQDIPPSSFKELWNSNGNVEENKTKFYFQRSPELIYGLRNFIGNAVKFSKTTVEIKVKSNDKELEVSINDDGPGFPEDIKEILGEPYIKSKSRDINVNAGTGLGTFIGKTLLEKNSATITFKNYNKNNGAEVIIKWKNSELIKI